MGAPRRPVRLNEETLIARFRRALNGGRGPGVRVGIGDDTAVLEAAPRRGGRERLFTTDMLVEGRHFRLGEASAYQIGRKALAVNLSDIAAMGGRPTHAVAALGLPARTSARFVDGLARGLAAAARASGTVIVGGDTNGSDRLVISVALLGEAWGPRAVTRSGARPGDVLFVTGALGGSYASRRHLNFRPRLTEARYLAARFRVRAMMDLSDGLAADLPRLAAASGVGARVLAEAVPVHRDARGSLKAALADGEDFELLFALSPRDAARLERTRPPKGLARFTRIGRAVARAAGLRLVERGIERPLPRPGFDHFR